MCQRRGCRREIAPGLFACDEHWAELPDSIKWDLIGAVEETGQHSAETMDAVRVVVTTLRSAP